MLVAICNRLFQIGRETRTIEIDDSIVRRYASDTERDRESYTEVCDVCLSRPVILDVQVCPILMADLKVRFETLTPREREVMAFVATGRLNKQIAADLGVSEITVKVHRGQVMRKMQASSLPDLARMADQLQLTPTKPRSPGRVA